jgi:hypothetical protein
LVVALIALAARVLPSPRTIDDAFITFRYARNLLDGLGFVYNSGERVLGTTTPLYTLLMAGLALVTGWRDFPWIGLLTNAAADAATCVLLVRLGERLSASRLVGLGAAALWAVAPMSVTFAIGGMETSVFICLLTLTAELYLAGRERPAAFTAALSLLTRPDGIIFVGPLMVDWLWSRLSRAQRAPKDALVARTLTSAPAVFSLTLLPWAIFATLYFGSPIPHSVTAKAQAYLIDPGSALIRLLQHYSTPFFEHELLGNFWNLAGVFVYLFLALAGALTALRRDRRAWPMALYPWLYFIVFALANPLLFRWYLAPPLPFYFLFILTGIGRPRGGQPQGLPLRVRSALPLAPLAFFLFTSLRAWTPRPDHGPQRPAPVMAWHALELLYAEVGRDLAPRVTAQQTVIAAGDIGALGYYSNARILDTVGLISPQTVRYYPLDRALYTSIDYAIAPGLIVDEAPDFAVFLETYGRNGLLRDQRFLSAYTLVEKIPTAIYDSDGLLIYARAGP